MNKIYITGDIHGDKNELKNRFEQIKDCDDTDILIIAGDAGFEYGTYVMGAAKKICKKFPGYILVIRGNHDNRYWRDHSKDWIIKRMFDNWVLFEPKYPNILYTVDGGGIYKINGKNFLFVPGAYSVDKYYRLNNYLPFEEEEMLNSNEVDCFLYLLKFNTSFDYIISHTYPGIIEDKVEHYFMGNIDQSRINKDMEKFLSYIDMTIDYKHWFFGHLHGDEKIDDNHTILFRTVVDIDDYI